MKCEYGLVHILIITRIIATGLMASIFLFSLDDNNQLGSQLRQIESAIQLSLSKSDGLDAAIMLHYKDIDLIQKHIVEPHQIYVSVRNSLQYCLWKKYSSR